MKIKPKQYAVVSLLTWAIISLYFGIGGSLKTENYNLISEQYSFSDTASVRDSKTGLEFKNFAEMMLYKEDEKAAAYFPFLPLLPDFLGTILTACFFSMLGGVIGILKDIALLNEKPEETNYISIPLLSFFNGLIILGITYVIPTLLIIGEAKLRPVTLLFFCLFAGIFTRKFYRFINSLATKTLFKNEK